MKPARQSTLLIADDTELVRDLVVRTLESANLYADAFESGDALLKAWHDNVLVCVLDMRMPGRDGLACLQEIKRRSPRTEVILLTGVDEARSAVDSLKAGAFDYLTKPISPSDLIRAVRKGLQLALTARENAEIRHSVSTTGPVAEMLGTSAAMTQVRHLVGLVAPTEETVLLTGESGTGKTLAARAIHHASLRHEAPFISVSCPSLPQDLLESEMFGHEKGAFSGAHQRRLGRVELAKGGTLFLDEIGEMPLELQAKLLTFLQDRTFFRVGGEAPLTADVRIIAATNQDLLKRCREGRFREDLYYRLHVVPIELPTLRARAADIPALATNFLNNFAQRNRRPARRLTAAAIDALLRHPWPGNIRELENLLARAATLATEREIDASDFAFPAASANANPAATSSAAVDQMSASSASPFSALVGLTLAELERRALTETLTVCGQNRARAARLLGISEKTIYNLMRRYAAPDATATEGKSAAVSVSPFSSAA